MGSNNNNDDNNNDNNDNINSIEGSRLSSLTSAHVKNITRQTEILATTTPPYGATRPSIGKR